MSRIPPASVSEIHLGSVGRFSNTRTGRVPDRRRVRVEADGCSRGPARSSGESDGSDAVPAFAFAHDGRQGGSVQAVPSRSPPPFHGAESTPAGQALTAEVASAKEAAMAEALEPWQRKFPAVPVTAQCGPGRPAYDLVAASRDAGLVVVGRRTRRSPVGAYLGAVTHAHA
ncbi:universal stress protein [Streptomyces goshikiensis]|uniref:universal stress protein n=1 Tax=Streptomyces goshikiensis TaxID=1942 RepID=UPI0037AD9AF2